jgi:hypothetical protein
VTALGGRESPGEFTASVCKAVTVAVLQWCVCVDMWWDTAGVFVWLCV